jgi:dihydroorotate dehydrogenase (NAD+) catalytic subunit
MIELAPQHKRGLSLRGPVLAASGILGYSDDYRRLIPLEALGALVTNPMTGRPRRGAPPPRVLGIPGGLLLHVGLDNPGVTQVIRRHSRRWEHSPVPVIAHVAGVNVDETWDCVERLCEVRALGGIELGLPDSTPLEDALEIVVAARGASLLPLIVKLPLWRATELAGRIVELDGADALTVAAPPRGTVWHHGHPVSGRLYGPATLPQSLWVLRQVVVAVGGAMPIIGCGGVHGVGDALTMLDAGAVAVQVDSYVWKDPGGFVRLVRAVAEQTGHAAPS